MRYRFSYWDPSVLVLFLAEIAGAWWLIQRAPAEIPLHWGAGGLPDRYGPPSLVGLLIGPLFAFGFYLMFRLLDFLMAVRRPGFHGFLTAFAGGMALMLAALEGLQLAATVQPAFRFQPVPLFGLFFLYVGALFLRTPDLPMNTAGMVADTPEAQAVVRVTMGKGFMWTGAASALLGLLPGAWSMAALAPLLFGPLAAIVVALVRAPSR